MSNRYSQMSTADNVRFAHALFAEAERSRMTATPIRLTTFNAGDIVPIYCKEILPSEEISMDLDFVIRQTTLLTPTMGNMHVDIYAFFVPNRIVNQSWSAVLGENLSGSWTAPQVSLAPLVNTSVGSVHIPVGSVADYYDFPTQQPIPYSVLSLCHDLKFRGYIMIYNEHFRDQNYQPPVPMSTLNIYQNFLGSPSVRDSVVVASGLDTSVVPDGSVGEGAIANAIVGSGMLADTITDGNISVDFTSNSAYGLTFSAIGGPFKANKMHDYFTSVLPSPQKSQSSVFAPATGNVNVNIPQLFVTTLNSELTGSYPGLRFRGAAGPIENPGYLYIPTITGGGQTAQVLNMNNPVDSTPGSALQEIHPSNLGTIPTRLSGTATGIGISVDDLRMASAIQQVYEIQARGGTRYREIVQSFFGITADDPFTNVPRCLGHISRDLDLYQTAQTSASEAGSTPQGNLSAFGYTSNGGHLFHSTFVEHGYLHVFAVVRHRNIYSSMMDRDNFRLNMLDYYFPPLANISEQPVYTYQINPFSPTPNGVFGYQEAWAEYRFEPDRVSGYMRPAPSGATSLSIWNYADSFDNTITSANGNWLLSNSQEVLDRTLAVQSTVEGAPQFKAQFKFYVDKTLPMPTYSVPGLDII